MSKISSFSPKKSLKLNRVKSNNKRLVNILSHKMFKGFRNIKLSKEFNIKKPKYAQSMFWENKELDPFDDFYNFEYREKLFPLHNIDFSNILQIKNISTKNKLNQTTIQKKRELIKKISNTSKKRNNFRKKQKNQLKNRFNIDKYFYFSSNSLLIRNDLENNKDKKDKLFKTIFSDENEKGLYNDIPIFAIEKIHKNNDGKNKTKKKFIFLPSKEERISDLQFLYKLSHKIPLKKVDFRNKYNIRSAKVRNKSINIENVMIKSFPFQIGPAKPNKTTFSLQNKSKVFITSFFNNDNKIKDKGIIENKEISNINNFNNELLKRAKSSVEPKSRKRSLINNKSDGFLDINRDLLFYNKENENEKPKKVFEFPTKDRFISDQILINYMDNKKRKFDLLRNMIEN